MTKTDFTPIQAFAGDEYDAARADRYSAEYAKRRGGDGMMWRIPAWAEQTMFNSDDDTAVHYSSEGDPIAYAVHYDTADGKYADVPPSLIVTLGGHDSVTLDPSDGKEVRDLALELLAIAHIWDDIPADPRS